MAEEKKVNPFDLSNQAAQKGTKSNLVKGIVDTATNKKAANLLEAAPEIDMSLLREVAPTESVLLMVLKIALGTLATFSLFSVLFFTSQLTSRFDFAASVIYIPNKSEELAVSNNEIVSLKTDLNFYKYLQIKAHFDEFSFFGDSYLQGYDVLNSQTAEKKDKTNARKRMDASKPELKKAFLNVREKLILPLEAKLSNPKLIEGTTEKELFIKQLRLKLTAKAKELSGSKESEAISQAKAYTQSVKLVGNQKLINSIIKTDFDDLDAKGLYSFVKEINSLVVNDLSFMQEVKDKRIKWSDIMNEIQLRTIAVDRHYDDKLYDQIGGIRYTNYDFDGDTAQISITGETKKIGTTNFSLIADLIDELNTSKLFGKAQMNSFSKSGSLEEGYKANLKLDLELTEEE